MVSGKCGTQTEEVCFIDSPAMEVFFKWSITLLNDRSFYSGTASIGGTEHY